MKADNELTGGTNERIVLDFKHLPGGRNCMTSSLWKMLNHLGIKISEEMLMGIASGLGFIYWNMKQLPVPFVGGMNGGRFPTILGIAVDRLGGQWSVIKSSSLKRAHEQMKGVLSENIPALVCVDIGFLDYLSMGEDDHFGMHTVLVSGVDEIKNEAYISDRFSTPITISLSSLQQARASKYHPFPAENKLMTVQMSGKLTPLEDIIPMAIRENAQFMLNPPISNMGIKGILRWRKELQKYPKLMPNAKLLVQALCEHYVYIETGGSGGALFRRMYSDFLAESSTILRDKLVKNASLEYARISEAWSDLAKMLLPEDRPTLYEIREILWSYNKELEERGVDAFQDVREKAMRLMELYRLAEKEVTDFVGILDPVLLQLELLHDMELETMQKLAKWSEGF
ncbi:MAG: BtrH N-terminal domain-containing protein [Candidatus Thorarchaeota archaeon]|nr:BtrH N-terminal domain-containing protein [Candidatus Thorarchaeota archaeon]